MWLKYSVALLAQIFVSTWLKYSLTFPESELSIVVAWRKGAYLYQAAKELIKVADEINVSDEHCRRKES